MRRLIHTFSLLFLVFGLVACATPGTYQSGYGNFGNVISRHRYALSGAALGGAGGALIGGAVTRDGQGALVGGALGAAAGGLIGHSMDNQSRRDAYYGEDYRYPNAYRGY